jgi:hypothetical protein
MDVYSMLFGDRGYGCTSVVMPPSALDRLGMYRNLYSNC